MTIFTQSDTHSESLELNKPGIALKFLEYAAYACIRSHLEDINSSIGIPEMKIRIGGGWIQIIIPTTHKKEIMQACLECYVLNNLKIPFCIFVDDAEPGNIAHVSVSATDVDRTNLIKSLEEGGNV